MSKKLFESELSKSIAAVCCYYYKPPDGVLGNSNKVDFLAVYRGRFYGLEAKQTPYASLSVADVTANQKRSLESIVDGGGFGAVLVNFNRRPGNRGVVGVFPVHTFQRDGLYDWPKALMLAEARYRLDPSPGGTWNIGMVLGVGPSELDVIARAHGS